MNIAAFKPQARSKARLTIPYSLGSLSPDERLMRLGSGPSLWMARSAQKMARASGPNAFAGRQVEGKPDLTTAAGVAAFFGMSVDSEPQMRADDDARVTVAQLAEFDTDTLSRLIDTQARLIENLHADLESPSASVRQRAEGRLDDAEEEMALAQAEMDSRKPRGRRTAADGEHQTRAQADAGGRRARGSVPAQPRDRRNAARHDFKDEVEFFTVVANSSQKGVTPDPRLFSNAAPNTYGQEGIGADGGFAVPPDFRSDIVKKVLGVDSLLSLTDQLVTSSNSITTPIDETTPWQQSGGIQAFWESEGGLKSQSKPALGDVTIKLNKLIALIPMTDELLQDAPAMASYVSTKAPEKMLYRVNDAIINGDGIGKPLGFLNSGALVTVAKEAGQAAGSIVFANITNMFSRLPASSQSRAAWLINSDAMPQLMTMSFPGTGTAVPAYLPPGGLSASPYGTLLGRPVIPTEAAAPMGSLGDISLVDLKQYMSAAKSGGIRQDVSIHVWFDYDITAFRFVLRVGGQPWWNTPITRPNGLSRSPFVALAPRS